MIRIGVHILAAVCLVGLMLSRPAFADATLAPVSGGDSLGAVSKSAFCSRSVARDYEQVFDRLPRVRSIPKSGILSFGPSGLRIRRPKHAVLVAPARVQFELFIESADDLRLNLDWQIDLTARKINRTGVIHSVIARKRHMVDVIDRSYLSAITLTLPTVLGVYRVDLELRNRNGGLLGRYGQYVRVMRPETHARLVIDNAPVQPGDEMAFRVENLGTNPIGLIGEDYVLERYWAGGWKRDPASPSAFTRQRLGPVLAGSAGFCRTFAIPSDISPGLYRISKRIATVGRSRARMLRAPFQISSP